jgi:hypothetical protein
LLVVLTKFQKKDWVVATKTSVPTIFSKDQLIAEIKPRKKQILVAR